MQGHPETGLSWHGPAGSPTTGSEAASRALCTAVHAMLAHRGDTPLHLHAALDADAELVLGHALAGLLQCLLARRDALAQAGRSLAAARAGLRARGGTARERSFVAALAAWQEDGDMEGAARLLEGVLATDPLDLAALKLAHAVRFMLGDAAGMRLAVELALPAWSDALPGYGFVLGCHAFALEETGAAGAALRAGRRAVELEPADLWAAHAVAHVLEAAGRAREGLAWLGRCEARLPAAPTFARHIVWHRALFHLHLDEPAAALALHDAWLRGAPAGDYRDLANAASLLWRMQAQGVAVGAARWAELAEIAEARIGDHHLAFADLHHLLALAHAGRQAALESFLRGLRARAMTGTDCQARILARFGLTAAEAVVAAAQGDAGAALDLFAATRPRMAALGGSHAQRDLFERMAIDAALAAGRDAEAEAMLRARATLRVPGAWEARCRRTARDPQPPLRSDRAA